MALIVETGTGSAASESYVSTATVAAYAVARGALFSVTDIVAAEAACRRGTAAIDNRYRPRFVGYRTNRHVQALEWPRAAAYYYTPQAASMPFGMIGGQGYGQGYRLYEYDQIDSTVIPREITNATCEAAIRELASPGIMAPDLDRGGMITSATAGPVSVTFSVGAPAMTVFHAITQALSALLTPPSPIAGMAVRS